jgi:hypothetical protein
MNSCSGQKNPGKFQIFCNKRVALLFPLFFSTMRGLIALCLLAFIGCAFAVRSQWVQLDRADPSAQKTIRFALTQYNLDVLEVYNLNSGLPLAFLLILTCSALYSTSLTPAPPTMVCFAYILETIFLNND